MPSPRRDHWPDDSSPILRCIDPGLSAVIRQCSCGRQMQGQAITDIHEVSFRDEEQSDVSIDGEARLLIKDLNRRVVRLEEQQVLLDKLDDKQRLDELQERFTILESKSLELKSRSAKVVAHHASVGTTWEGGRRLAALEALDVGTRLAAIEAAIAAGPLHHSFRQCSVFMTDANKDPCGTFEDPPTLSDAITEHVSQYVATFWKAASAAFRKDLAKLMADIRQVREHDMALQQRAGDQLSKQMREASGSLERRLELLEQHIVKCSPAGRMMPPNIRSESKKEDLKQSKDIQGYPLLESKKEDLKQSRDRQGADTSRSLLVVAPAEAGGGPAAPLVPRFLSAPMARNEFGTGHPVVSVRCESRQSRSSNGQEAKPGIPFLAKRP